MKVNYKIYVEGGLVEQTTSFAKANRLREKYEAEGWNVKVIKEVPTIVGIMGVEI